MANHYTLGIVEGMKRLRSVIARSFAFPLYLVFVACNCLAADTCETSDELMRYSSVSPTSTYFVQICKNGSMWAQEKDTHGRLKNVFRHLSPEELKQLNNIFQSENFFSLRDFYAIDSSPNKDGLVTATRGDKSASLSYSYGGRSKKIVRFGDAPKELLDLENKVIKLTGIKPWIF